MAAKRLLILGGTSDASKLANLACILPNLEVIVSLAGCTRQSANIPSIVRFGGLGGITGLTTYLQNEAIDLVIDATHPFAAQISWNTAAATKELGLPRLMLIRPEWQNIAGDCWVEVDSLQAAAFSLQHQQNSQRVFLAIGRQQLSVFSQLENIWFLMRSIDPPPPHIAVPKGQLLLSKGPFLLESEKQLLLKHTIDTIVSKNSGGDATYAKILAARELGIKVVMVQRPKMPEGEKIADIEAAMAWLVSKIKST